MPPPRCASHQKRSAIDRCDHSRGSAAGIAGFVVRFVEDDPSVLAGVKRAGK